MALWNHLTSSMWTRCHFTVSPPPFCLPPPVSQHSCHNKTEETQVLCAENALPRYDFIKTRKGEFRFLSPYINKNSNSYHSFRAYCVTGTGLNALPTYNLNILKWTSTTIWWVINTLFLWMRKLRLSVK